MKKIALLMTLIFMAPLFFLQSKAQAAEISLTAENFPDAVVLKAAKKADKDGNGVLSQKEIDEVVELNMGTKGKNINLKNVSVFANLKKFTVTGKRIDNLDEIYMLNKCEELEMNDYTYVDNLDFSRIQTLRKLTVSYVSIQKLIVNNANLQEAVIQVTDVKKTEPIDLGGNVKLEKLTLPDKTYERVKLSGNNYIKKLVLDGAMVSQIELMDMNNLESIELPWFNDSLRKMKVVNCPKLRVLDTNIMDNLTSMELKNLPLLAGFSIDAQKLKQLDLSPFTKLVGITVKSSSMTKLKLPKKAPVNNLDVIGTKVKAINLQNYRKLKYCNIEMPKLKTINVAKNTKISELDISDCHALKKVDLSKNKKIEKLYMTDNKKMQTIKLPKKNKIKFYTLNLMPKLTKINLGCLTKLKTLSASRITKIKKLDLSKLKKLDSFEWTHGSLTKIKWGKKSHYREINIKRNKLSGKLNLKPFTGLVFFYCNHNNYTEIIGGYYLVNFTCDYNKKLKKLDMRKSTELNGFSAYGVKKAKIYLYDSVMEFGPHLDTKNVKYVKKY